MTRNVVHVLPACALLSLIAVTFATTVAQAASNPTNLPGKVSCSPSGGQSSGAISFSPPLINGGTSSTETFTVQATLGNTASPCVTTPGFAALGTIVGKLKFNIPGNANNCARIFSGVALPAPTAGSHFKVTWTTPAGANPTTWTQPSAFSVIGAATFASIAIEHGMVGGSFTPMAAPKATLSDANWPGASGAVSTGCSSTAGCRA